MERGSRRRESRPATGEEAAAAAGAGGDVVFGAAAAAGSSRPYHECSFCKHGFTSAQALGGHMNIHRRDRASRRPGRDVPAGTSSPASRSTERYSQYRDMAYPPAAPPVSGGYSMYYPGASAAGDTVGAGGPSSTELNLFGAAAAHHDHDWRLDLGYHGRHGGPLVPEEMEQPAGEPERNLDLELRLGRHPSWQ